MSNDNRINKNTRKILEEIENVIGVSLRRVNMTNFTNTETVFNFNDNGFVTMLGFDLAELNLEDEKLDKLGESVKELENVERILLNCPKGKNIPVWLKDLTYIKELVLNDCYLTEIPEYIKNFNNLTHLYLLGNLISELPDWLLHFSELKVFNLNNQAQTLDPTQSNMEILKSLEEKGVKVVDPTYTLYSKLNVPLDQIEIVQKISWYEDGLNRIYSRSLRSAEEQWTDPRAYGVSVFIFEGKILQMSFNGASLEELPEDFGGLKDLNFISITDSKLRSLPESIGELNNLKELRLSGNNLSYLSDTFTKLTSLQKLDLSKNQFKELPTQLWALKNVSEFRLNDNPLSQEEQTISEKVPDLIREYLRKKATIVVFISHAVIDFEPYRIKDLVDYLEKQKEISQVYFCEEDLAGNIDEWMLDTVQKSQLILFIGTNKSVYNSPDCENELQLADKYSIPIIPLKGKDVDWPDLAQKKLSRELGLEYDVDNFDIFCQNLYKYIENFKREINLMEKEERLFGILGIFERFRLILDDTFADLVGKINSLSNQMDDFDERISKIEKRNQ